MKEQHWAWPGVREMLFNDLESLYNKCGPWDLVLLTGDLTQQGSAEEFRKVKEFLEQLWEFFGRLECCPALLAVPGNHDLVRPDIKNPSVILLRQWDSQQEIQEEFWNEKKSPYRRVVAKAFADYSAWWENQLFRPGNLISGIMPGDFSATVEKNGAKLGIVGLNTAFLQLTGDKYRGRLALHAGQFHEVCGGDGPGWAKQHNACLFMTHHPPAWLNHESVKHLNEEITAHGRFAAHICGHLYEVVYRDMSEGGAESRRIWQGRSLFGLEYFGKSEIRLHGYSAGRIELCEKQGKILFWPREARLQGGQRKIVPDYSVDLTDNQHTHPKNFNLLQSF
ncbi:MAG: hypothetical protein GY749_06390 [Desulfobacteraceae bacterium]|nr:hypothetical protein [Desulfobacteraceae bacterium]